MGKFDHTTPRTDECQGLNLWKSNLRLFAQIPSQDKLPTWYKAASDDAVEKFLAAHNHVTNPVKGNI